MLNNPQTPLSKAPHPRQTPTFSFGLSFLPSFNFSPFSPKKMAATAPSVRHNLVDSNSTMDTSDSKEIDIWSSLNDNLTSLSSVYEESDREKNEEKSDSRLDKENFLTPTKLMKTNVSTALLNDGFRVNRNGLDRGSKADLRESNRVDLGLKNGPEDGLNSNNLGSKNNLRDGASKNLIVGESSNRSEKSNDLKQEFATPKKLIKQSKKKSSKDSIGDHAGNEVNQKSNPKSDVPQKLQNKRRRVSNMSNVSTSPNGTQSSPNGALASLIATQISSPLPHTSKKAIESDDKVWSTSLDDVLINCYLKYRQYKEKFGFNSSSALSGTAQNKVISWMILYKSGLTRTPQQISSRLFRLSKTNKLLKLSNTRSNALKVDEWVVDPFDELCNPSGISTSESLPTDDIDRELDLIFSSPLENSDHGNNNPKFNFIPRVVSLALSREGDFHNFTQLDPQIQPEQDFNSLSLRLPSLAQFSESMQKNMKSTQAWFVNHSINLEMGLPPNMMTSTPISPFANLFQQMATNLAEGNFSSYIQLEIHVQKKPLDPSAMLQWKSYNKVFNNNNIPIFESTDLLNGYKIEESKYDLQIPFLKQFFLGYFHFLINGGNPKELNLTVVQTLFEVDDNSAEFNANTSSIAGYLVHKVTAGNGITTCSKIQLDSSKNSPEFDENETEFADSSPFRPSPRSHAIDTPSRRRGNNLSINVNHANMFNHPGPMTAPVYNASVVTQKLNAEQINMRNQQLQMQQSVQRPGNGLHHAKSTNNIPQSMAQGFNESRLPPTFSNPQGAPLNQFHQAQNRNLNSVQSDFPQQQSNQQSQNNQTQAILHSDEVHSNQIQHRGLNTELQSTQNQMHTVQPSGGLNEIVSNQLNHNLPHSIPPGPAQPGIIPNFPSGMGVEMGQMNMHQINQQMNPQQINLQQMNNQQMNSQQMNPQQVQQINQQHINHINQQPVIQQHIHQQLNQPPMNSINQQTINELQINQQQINQMNQQHINQMQVDQQNQFMLAHKLVNPGQHGGQGFLDQSQYQQNLIYNDEQGLVYNQGQYFYPNKRNNITFGPILEYDPSKVEKKEKKVVSGGMHRFPATVSMFKADKVKKG